MSAMVEWDLTLDVDQVLRGQGAEPDIIRDRSPKLVDLAELAISEGSPLLEPQLVFRRLGLESVVHERLQLVGGSELQSKLLAQHLSPAEEIVLIVCTIGAGIDAWISEVSEEDTLYALTLDGLGNAAVEDLANQACRHFEKSARNRELETSIPLSPGMEDWPVDRGQDQIFDLLPADNIGVTLNPSRMMTPRKSLSMVIGIGRQMVSGARQCDYCMLNDTCRYQDHYA